MLDAQRLKQRVATAVVGGAAVPCTTTAGDDAPTVPPLHARVLDAFEGETTVAAREQPVSSSSDLPWSEDQYEALDVGAFIASIPQEGRS